MYSNDVECGVIMISPITGISKHYNIAFKADSADDNTEAKEDKLLDCGLYKKSRIAMDKFTKAFTIYPAKGLAGSKNSNFYEFLTMGTVPYLIGSGMLMAIFNSANSSFLPFDTKSAAKLGNKMALGVLFYGLFKEISKAFITYPVKWKTGVDTELPYKKVNHLLKEHEDDSESSIEYHKVGESVDFTRWDLLYAKPEDNKPLNYRFDKIAKKNGLGENLNDSDQEVKPIYKEILIKSKLAKSISSFMWAATGVALAFQKPWEKYFNVATLKFWKCEEFLHSAKVFGQSFVESAKDLFNGEVGATSKVAKHSGKVVIGLAVLSTLAGLLNTFHITKKPSRLTGEQVIDKNKESVVG
jgi:hypothetical protein